MFIEFHHTLTHCWETQAAMLNVSKRGFAFKFCVGVYFDDSATLTGKYFTHIKKIMTEYRSVYYGILF